jgi:hypothetical protein
VAISRTLTAQPGTARRRAICGYFLNGRTAPVRPGWVEVSGGVALSSGCPPAVSRCGSHLACGLPVTVARLWLQRGLPSSK